MSIFGTSTVFAKNIHEPIIPAIAKEQSKALLLGFAKNQYDLGMVYYDGVKIPRNTSKAIEWLDRASSKNYAPAKVILAKMLFSGDGLQVNEALAIQLLQQANAQGYEPAKQMLVDYANKQKSQPSYSAIDQTLLCGAWNTQKMTVDSFIEQLATHSVAGKTHKSLETALKQNYSEQDQYKFYPEYEDAEGDTPDVRIFLPRNKSTALFTKIETENYYGYGYKFNAEIKQGVAIEHVKNMIEARDKFKFSTFDTQKFNQYMKEIQRLRNIDQNDKAQNLSEKMSNMFKGSHVVSESNPQQIYLATSPRVVDDGFVHFIDYIYLIKQENGNLKVVCGSSS